LNEKNARENDAERRQAKESIRSDVKKRSARGRNRANVKRGEKEKKDSPVPENGRCA